MEIVIVAIIFAVIWGWIFYEMYYAPEYDENEMPIEKSKFDWVDRVFKKDDNNNDDDDE